MAAGSTTPPFSAFGPLFFILVSEPWGQTTVFPMGNLDQVLDVVRDAILGVNTLQGLIIAFLGALIMARYNRILFFALLALFFDQFLVPLGIRALKGKSLETIMGDAVDILTNLDPQIVVLRYIAFFIVISILFGIKRIFYRFGAA